MAQPNMFQHLLTGTDNFVITCELIPGLVSGGKKLDSILAFAEQGRDTGLFHAISLTDNPGGMPALMPDEIAREIEALGMSAIVHVTTKDMNRNMIESRVRALDRMGVRNLLVMSGDFPTSGQAGLPMPSFDLDPVHVLTMITLMNRGWRIGGNGRSHEETPKTSFFHGTVVSPFKCTEPEVMSQLFKLEKKARAGAQFLITQMGFDEAGLKPFMTTIKERGVSIPMLGSVFILRKGAASAMHRGDVPGALVTDDLLKTIEQEAGAADKGKASSLERAAKQVAVLKGLGFRGAHIEALVMTFDMVETVLGRASELAPKWEECAEELAYSPNGSYVIGGTQPGASLMGPKLRRGWLMYRTMRLLHDILFIKTGIRGSLMRSFCRLLDKVKPIGACSHVGETILKGALFGCKDCGDCALPELHYLCPHSQCPKQQRNGPCGGSKQDACEVYPDRPCVWTRVYTRAKAFGELDTLGATIIAPRDWRLRDTSGWVNYHLNRDHTGYEYTTFLDLQERQEEAGK